MKISDLILIGAAAIAAYFVLTRRTAAAVNASSGPGYDGVTAGSLQAQMLYQQTMGF